MFKELKISLQLADLEKSVITFLPLSLLNTACEACHCPLTRSNEPMNKAREGNMLHEFNVSQLH